MIVFALGSTVGGCRRARSARATSTLKQLLRTKYQVFLLRCQLGPFSAELAKKGVMEAAVLLVRFIVPFTLRYIMCI